MNAHQETEVKFSVPALDAVAARLAEAGAELAVPRVYERNIRYENAQKTLKAQGIVVRLRQDQRARLTYKEPPQPGGDEDIPSRFEAEVEVSDFDTMALILQKLGYSPAMTYEKFRTTYRLHDTEVVLDEMPYGSFVEIEGVPDAIRRVIPLLGLENARRHKSNYVQLFDRVRQQLNLTFDDLTFANFDGLAVPESAFEPPA